MEIRLGVVLMPDYTPTGPVRPGGYPVYNR